MEDIRHTLKKYWNIVLTIFGIYAILINIIIEVPAITHNYSDIDSVPHHKVGIVIGNIHPNDRNAPYDDYTLNSLKKAATLHNNGKIDQVFVSGSWAVRKGHFNTSAMVDSLIAFGVPVDRIIRDQNSPNVIESLDRAKQVYHCDSVLIISQRLRNGRALSIARLKGINSTSITASTKTQKHHSIKTELISEVWERLCLPFEYFFR